MAQACLPTAPGGSARTLGSSLLEDLAEEKKGVGAWRGQLAFTEGTPAQTAPQGHGQGAELEPTDGVDLSPTQGSALGLFGWH